MRAIGILLVALAAGCAGAKDPAARVMGQTERLKVDPSLVKPNPDALVATVPASTSPRQSAAPKRPPPSAAPASVAASPVAVEHPRKNTDPPPVARTLEPPLDVAALKVRLRDTHAIGVFTKVALKNQMDDLLQQFRAHYQGGEKTSVDSLRQPYDMLVLKVLSVVQDGDPSLARTISGSREAIWSILADRDKFNSIT